MDGNWLQFGNHLVNPDHIIDIDLEYRAPNAPTSGPNSATRVCAWLTTATNSHLTGLLATNPTLADGMCPIRVVTDTSEQSQQARRYFREVTGRGNGGGVTMVASSGEERPKAAGRG